ncbi:MBL fold metallo-hydrolase [Halobacteria archaeon AArc-m2/3/4]|uniref:MBL fold metallo-hydrolase n=1 Tax=Natronoglomus mannanivorans TaxID=2979990 RepID=A0ABT2QGM0_9EURY|nr:MBL fold metallo-hydrolase [Halobacteria archaeon AArc-m2/3/4]
MRDDIDSEELAPGVHRVETVTDGKIHGYHVLEGPTGPVLVDPGYVDAPTTVYEPFLEARGWELSDVGLAIVTHSDADHFGGNHELREHSPGVTIAGHEADAHLMERTDRILEERYSMFEPDHGITYEQDVYDWLTGMMGPDESIDLRLRGGETIRVRDRQLRTLHTPGHTAGHLMLYDAAHDLVIGADGFFGRGLYDVDGEYLQPPPYYLSPEYENTIALVESLAPETLSFTHYEVLREEAIDEFVQESLDFVAEIETLALELVDERGPITLEEAIEGVVDRRGSFGLDLDLAFPLSAHYTDHVDRGELETVERDGRVAWVRP